MEGFEPPALASQTRCATKLRHIPLGLVLVLAQVRFGVFERSLQVIRPCWHGGARTPDLLINSQTLYHLSYMPWLQRSQASPPEFPTFAFLTIGWSDLCSWVTPLWFIKNLARIVGFEPTSIGLEPIILAVELDPQGGDLIPLGQCEAALP